MRVVLLFVRTHRTEEKVIHAGFIVVQLFCEGQHIDMSLSGIFTCLHITAGSLQDDSWTSLAGIPIDCH
jgi:hypothetical protein